jgi:hypothetical protein
MGEDLYQMRLWYWRNRTDRIFKRRTSYTRPGRSGLAEWGEVMMELKEKTPRVVPGKHPWPVEIRRGPGNFSYFMMG